MATEVTLTEEFNDPQGVIWNNYDAYQEVDRTRMAAVRHVDLRTFTQADYAVTKTVLYLSTQNMGVFSTQTMSQLAGNVSLGKGENWQGAICENVTYSTANIVLNPSFEVNTTGWATAGTAPSTFARQNGWASVGTWSLRFAATEANSGNWTEYSPPVPSVYDQALAGYIIPGLTYSIQHRLNVQTQNGGNIRHLVTWYNAAGGTISTPQVDVVNNATGLRTIQATFVAPAGAVAMSVRMQWFGVGAGATSFDTYIDAVQITAGTSPAYFDGATSGYAWSGTAHNSVSGIPVYGNVLSIPATSAAVASASSLVASSYGALATTNYTNLVANPSLELDTTDWITSANFIHNAGGVITRTLGVSAAGAAYLNVLMTNAAAAIHGTTYQLTGTFKAGVTYTGSIYLKSLAGSNGSFNIFLGISGDSNSVTASSVSTSTWTRYSVSWTPSADRTSVLFGLRNNNGAAVSSTLGVDAAQVIASGTPVYFDGDQAAYSWLGTPHASASVGPYTTTLESTDLSSFASTDHVVLSCPEWHGQNLTMASCFLDLTSNASGDFTAGPTASAAFSTSAAAPVAGSPAELRFLTSQFASIDLSKVTGVRIRLTSADTTSVLHRFAAGVRVLPAAWQYTGLDIDTRFGRLRKTLPRDANPVTSPSFTWPTLWRSESPSGDGDPTPIDSEFGVVFNPGPAITASNTISLYFREVTQDFLTQLDLNSIPQQVFDGYNQPDIGTAKFNSRTQADLERYAQTGLDSEVNFNLERTADSLSASWIQVFLQWGVGGAGTVTLVNTEGGGYSFPLTTALSVGTSYVFRVRVEDTGVQAQVYSLSGTNDIVAKVFDSTLINDGFVFKRRKGRFGWSADLKDGGAYVDSIRQRFANFAEYRSLPFLSNTPVVGAELFVGNTPNKELYAAPLNHGLYITTGTVISTDKKLTTTGSSNKITNTDSTPLQGVQTNSFLINDWANSGIKFDVYYPTSASPLKAFLFSEDNVQQIPLVLPEIAKDEWQSISIEFPLDATLTGRYKLVVIQLGSGSANWWIDNISIFARSVIWDGRSVADDPWKSNNAQWTTFKDIENKENGGVVFPRRGNELQIRGRAMRQFAEIDRVHFLPRYAGLGNLPAQAIPYVTQGKPTGGAVTVSFSTANPGTPALTRNLTASAVSNYGFLPTAAVSCQWNFGDGTTGYGDVVQHTWAAAGTYSVTLVATDRFGYQGTYTANVTV